VVGVGVVLVEQVSMPLPQLVVMVEILQFKVQLREIVQVAVVEQAEMRMNLGIMVSMVVVVALAEVAVVLVLEAVQYTAPEEEEVEGPAVM
jgi:hypothetical protein